MSGPKHLNSMDELESLLRESGILRRYSIRRLGVFGSFARNERANDIDLLIEDDLSLAGAIRFRDELAAMVDNRLDIMLERFANPILMHRAKKDMRYIA